MRKIAVFLMLFLLSIGALRTFAQDATPTPAPSAQQSQQVQVPGYIGVDIFDRATQAIQAQDYQQAITDYSLFLLLNPTDSQTYYQRGSMYYRLNDYTNALADFNHALNLPQIAEEFTARTYALRAAIYSAQDHDDLALPDLNAGVDADPSVATLYYQRGRLHMRQEQWQDAVADFDKLVELAPDVSDGYALRGVAKLQLDQYDAALADYNKLASLTPDDSGVYIDRARIYIELKNYESALVDLNDAIRLEPGVGSLFLMRGSVNNQLGNSVDAASDYLEWVRSQQNNVNTDLTLRPNESQVVQLRTGQFYVMSFRGQAGQKITLSASARPNENTDPILLVMGSGTRPLIADDDGGGNLDAAINEYVLPTDGQYGVVVGYGGGGTNGPVRVLLQIVP